MLNTNLFKTLALTLAALFITVAVNNITFIAATKLAIVITLATAPLMLILTASAVVQLNNALNNGHIKPIGFAVRFAAYGSTFTYVFVTVLNAGLLTI